MNDIRNIINSTLSLIESNQLRADEKTSYTSFLKRFLSKRNIDYTNDVNEIARKVNRLSLRINDYGKDEVINFLQKHYGIEILKDIDEKLKTYNSSTAEETVFQTGHTDEISKLNAIISDLKTKGRQVVASRDKWKERAEVAEVNLKNNGCTDIKFKKVKKSFSKMYHPDCLSDNGFEKLIKQEIFKEFWQVIESIEKNET